MGVHTVLLPTLSLASQTWKRPMGANQFSSKPWPERLWAKVDSSAGSEGCWPWTGARSTRGYGSMCYKNRIWRVPRLAWTLTYGSIPAGYHVCHHCDNPLCVNMKHLFLGTNRDNALDRARKGRNPHVLHPERVPRGVGHHQAKFTAEQIHTIRALCHARAHSQRQVGQMFGAAQQTISDIVTGQHYVNLAAVGREGI